MHLTAKRIFHHITNNFLQLQKLLILNAQKDIITVFNVQMQKEAKKRDMLTINSSEHYCIFFILVRQQSSVLLINIISASERKYCILVRTISVQTVFNIFFSSIAITVAIIVAYACSNLFACTKCMCICIKCMWKSSMLQVLVQGSACTKCICTDTFHCQ